MDLSLRGPQTRDITSSGKTIVAGTSGDISSRYGRPNALGIGGSEEHPTMALAECDTLSGK